jgi:hypothetical protein
MLTSMNTSPRKTSQHRYRHEGTPATDRERPGALAQLTYGIRRKEREDPPHRAEEIPAEFTHRSGGFTSSRAKERKHQPLGSSSMVLHQYDAHSRSLATCGIAQKKRSADGVQATPNTNPETHFTIHITQNNSLHIPHNTYHTTHTTQHIPHDALHTTHTT